MRVAASELEIGLGRALDLHESARRSENGLAAAQIRALAASAGLFLEINGAFLP